MVEIIKRKLKGTQSTKRIRSSNIFVLWRGFSAPISELDGNFYDDHSGHDVRDLSKVSDMLESLSVT